MTSRRHLSLAAAIAFLIAVITFNGMAQPVQEVLVRCSPDELKKIRAAYGAVVLDAMPGGDIYLLSLPSSVPFNALKAMSTTMSVSTNSLLTMSDPFQTPTSSATTQWKSVSFYTSNAPDFYVNQPAMQKIQAREAHPYTTGKRAIVALIDTGIDEQHPVLRNNVIPGRNYVKPSGNASESNDPVVDQSHSKVFELLQSHAKTFTLDGAQGALFQAVKGSVGYFFVDQSAASFLESAVPPAYGHGTMVAGVVHLIAPEALLMPMKAFDANGSANLWNVVRAIRDSADMGADVINMSFSMPPDATALEFLEKAAIDYAKSSNKGLVAAAGNSNSESPVAPASLNPVMGVAAVNIDDTKASFSNYGKYVGMSAPGANIITTYPGTFAIASGTSFSAPIASGLFALLKELGIDGSSSIGEIEGGSDPIYMFNPPEMKDMLGKGRINVFRTIRKKVN